MKLKQRTIRRLGAGTAMVALHEHSSDRAVAALVQRLLDGKSIALISDAGTPLISDPGFDLVRACRDQHVTVIPIPGCCAVIAALSVCGLATDHFSFEGFAPAKPVARRKFFQSLQGNRHTLVF